ncbi:coiled-coil domain-containing protein 13-like [Ptychodera flava]|uniref:coiled-coil domain-containing protein 13-like n=1 Tax=Ptychodera flava TaxID=63121 RepID=UPI00396A0A9A
METDNETLKQQFQVLQEQQQKKLLRLQQRKQEKEKKGKEKIEKTKEKEKEQQNGLQVDDDLGLSLAEPIQSSAFFNDELSTHLNQQIRELKDENGRLYKLLSERDYEIRKLKKQREEANLAMTGGGVASDTAASKIVDLSKKNRELTAEVESEKNKSRQLLRKVNDLEKEVMLAKRELSLEGSGKQKSHAAKMYTLGDTLEEQPAVDPAEMKALKEKITQSNLKMAEYRNQVQQLKQDLKIAQKVLEKEVGENVNIPALLNGTSNWRGRAQQIIGLQNKVSDLKSQLSHIQTRPTTEMSLEEQFMTMETTQNFSPRSATSSVYNDKNRSKLRNMERERREASQKAADELKALEEDYSKLKEKFDASKARNKVLTNEVKTLKQQVSTLIDKSTHDNELITALMSQQSQMKQIIEDNARLQKEVKEKQQKEVQLLQTKNVQDMGVVEQLKRLVSEKEQKVRVLEEEINQMRINHQRTHVGNVLERPPSRGHRPATVTISHNEISSGGDIVGSSRPSSSDSTLHSPQPPQSRQSSRNSNRPGSGNRDLPPRVPSRVIRSASTGNVSVNNSAMEELKLQCQEYKSFGQVAEVERDKLMELVAVLQQRNDESQQNITETQSRLVQLKQRNVQLEKQLGKARMDVANLSRAPGKKMKPVRSGSDLSQSLLSDEDLMRSDIPQTQDNIEELQTRLAIQIDENDALKAALQSTMKAKEDDLRLYHDMMDQTKQVFLQGLRQFRQQNAAS